MTIKGTASLDPTQKELILKLWNEEFSGTISLSSLSDFETYLSGVSDHFHFLLYDEMMTMKGWAFKFVRENARWFSMAIDETIQGQGFGAQLLEKLKENENSLNGWVVDHDRHIRKNGKPYFSPVNFYLKHGFSVIPEIRLETEKLSAVKMTWSRT